MNLQELKHKSPEDLLAFAEDLDIENASVPAQKQRESAVNRLGFTDRRSVFVDFALRQFGAGEHSGL